MPDPNNPHRRRHDVMEAGQAGPREIYHPAAHGLDGETIDNLIRAAFTDGVATGVREEQTRQMGWRLEREPGIHDDGYDAGVSAVLALLERRSAVRLYVDSAVERLEQSTAIRERLSYSKQLAILEGLQLAAGELRRLATDVEGFTVR